MHADAKIAYHRDTGGNNSKYGMVDTLATQPTNARGENVRVTKETMGEISR